MKTTYVAIAATCLLSYGAAHAADQGQWVTLGTAGGPPIHANQSQIANALVVGESVYIFDAGDGVLRQMAAANIPVTRIKAMFLTHLHPDHVMGVGALMLSRSANATPMQVLGPPGTKYFIDGLARAYVPVETASYGAGKGRYVDAVHASDLARVLKAPTVVYRDDAITVSAVDVDHFQQPPPKGRVPRAVAYRVEVGGRSIVFTGDLGPSDSIIALARDADVLISEVVDPDVVTGAAAGSIQANWARNHLMPSYVGHYAAAAGVKLLVLTHFVGKWNPADLSGYTKGLTDEYKGPVKLAHDLDRF